MAISFHLTWKANVHKNLYAIELIAICTSLYGCGLGSMLGTTCDNMGTSSSYTGSLIAAYSHGNEYHPKTSITLRDVNNKISSIYIDSVTAYASTSYMTGTLMMKFNIGNSIIDSGSITVASGLTNEIYIGSDPGLSYLNTTVKQFYDSLGKPIITFYSIGRCQ